MQKILCFIFFLFLISVFFNDLMLPIPGMHWFVQASFIISLLSFFILVVCYHKAFLKELYNIFLHRLSSLRIYIFMVVYILLITLIKGIYGQVDLKSSLLDEIGQYCFVILICYLVTYFIFKRIFRVLTIIKVIYSIIYIILILGCLDFIAYNFDVSFLKSFLRLFNTTSILVMGASEFIKSSVNGIYRVQSVYFEPGFYAEHLFILLPFVYTFSTIKKRIFKYKLVDTFVRVTYIPLFWINVILTQSPIWLCFSLLLTIYMYRALIIKFLIQKFYYIMTFFISVTLLFILIFSKINLEETYLYRIFKVVSNITDINMLIASEQSLGTRLSCIINLVDIGKQTPIFGIGHSNIKPFMVAQIQNNKSKVFVTQEMYYCILVKEKPSFQDPFLINFFVRYGFIGLFLFLYFIFHLQKNISCKHRQCHTLIKCLSDSLVLMLGATLITGCYDLPISDYIYHFIIGLSLGVESILIGQKNRKKFFINKNKRSQV